MSRTVSKAQLRAMRNGRKRAMQERRRNARDRVRAYRAWLKSGCPTMSVPVIPTDSDYRIVNGAER